MEVYIIGGLVVILICGIVIGIIAAIAKTIYKFLTKKR